MGVYTQSTQHEWAPDAATELTHGQWPHGLVSNRPDTGPIKYNLHITPSYSNSPADSPASATSYHSHSIPYAQSSNSKFTMHSGDSSVSVQSYHTTATRPTTPTLYVAYAPKPDTKTRQHQLYHNNYSKSSISLYTERRSTDSGLSGESTWEDIPPTIRRETHNHNPSFASIRSFMSGNKSREPLHTSTDSVPSPQAQSAVYLAPTPPPRRPAAAPDSAPLPEIELRLRQLSKVSRTLGEKVPAELVLGAASDYYLMGSSSMPPEPESPPITPPARSHSLRDPKKLARRASLSLLQFAGFNPATSQDSEAEPVPTHMRRTKNPRPIPSPLNLSPPSTPGPRKGRQRPESEIIVSPIAFAFPEYQPPPNLGLVHLGLKEFNRESFIDIPAIQLQESESRSATPTPSTPTNETYVVTPIQDDKKDYLSIPRADTPFGMYSEAEPEVPDVAIPVVPSRQTLSVVRRERRQGWSGEWNQHNMQDVISKLRTLK